MIIALEEAKYKLISYRETIAELGSAMKIDEMENCRFPTPVWSLENRDVTLVFKADVIRKPVKESGHLDVFDADFFCHFCFLVLL